MAHIFKIVLFRTLKTTIKRVLPNQIPIDYDDENYEYDDENGDYYDAYAVLQILHRLAHFW